MSDFNAGELLGSLLAGLTIGWGVGWAVWKLFRPHPFVGGLFCGVFFYSLYSFNTGDTSFTSRLSNIADPEFGSVALGVSIFIFSGLTIMRLNWGEPHQ